MAIKYHPLVQKTKVKLERLDKQKNVSWEEWRKFNGEFLPIHTEPKLRIRALKFMDTLIKKLEENNHSIKFEYQRCHIEMYGQLTEINLRQKFFRKRIKDASGYGTDTYEKSDKLEFQVGSYARKGWIDKKTKSLEDYLNVIYYYIEKDSARWAEWRRIQKIEEEKREAQRKVDEEIARQKAIEKEKFDKLLSDAENHNKANIIRFYLKAYEDKLLTSHPSENEFKDYLDWAYNKADEIDPLA
ncbi:hypothetical protein [Flavobacterium litorale]|uniref:Uncharacterized protein n=1 Tax=Flavobacterium litorale TaxID=2856519 RepID=A0ABX8VD86_9FLAO|nr:hypothetical protein [Flavobacterium litorale]QYJ68800.1 hypothetical protein K1I41_02660 [Flavobacterium litorale]